MSIKDNLKKAMPKKFIYEIEYIKTMTNANKTYREVEKDIELKYEEVFGRKIDWENPRTFNEKINVSKLYDPTPLKTLLTDKILAREWVKERLGRSCKMIPLIATYNSIDEIDFAGLPEQYVMKMNHDSHSIFICSNSTPITKDVIARYKYFLQKRNYAYVGFEMQYKEISPKIMIEEYMGNKMRDYKFYCFGEKIFACWVIFDRYTDYSCNFYDKNWKRLPFVKNGAPVRSGDIPKPKNYEKMWKMAECLCKGFDQVRVDLYEIDDEVYFGEMTFTSSCGFGAFEPEEIDYKLGRLWKLDIQSIQRRRLGLLESGAKLKD